MLNPALSEAAIGNLPAYAAPTDLGAPLEARARSYLDVNCAYCHQPGGLGRAQFDLRITTPLASSGIVNGPVVATYGIAGAKAIVPGDESRSMIHYRAAATQGVAKMPPLGRNTADAAGLSTLGQWIDSLAGLIPTLSMSQTPSGPALTWPITTNTFYLQSAASIDSLSWTSVPASQIQEDDTRFLVPLSPSNKPQFFRLSSQAPLP
jgi:hypothetical protein